MWTKRTLDYCLNLKNR